MNPQHSRVMAFGRATLRLYLIVAAFMFIGGFVGGAALALIGYELPGIN